MCPGQHSTVSVCPEVAVPGSLEPSCRSGMLERDAPWPPEDACGPMPCALCAVVPGASQGQGGLQRVEAP